MENDTGRPGAMPLLVIGYDRYPAAHSALRMAADLSLRLRTRLLVVHVIDLDDYPIDPDSADWDSFAEQTVAIERVQAQTLLADHHLPWDFQVERGEVTRRLLEVAAAHNALMIVLGAARRQWGVRLGTSVARHLTRHADRPVLVVPEA